MNRDKQVLIIDDDSRNIFALTAVLKARGLKILSAMDMQEAFALLEKEPSIGIILIDMMMPDMDGYQAIPKIKGDNRYASIPVISVTAQAMAGDREKIMAAGADGYLSKPVDVDLMMEVLNEYLK